MVLRQQSENDCVVLASRPFVATRAKNGTRQGYPETRIFKKYKTTRKDEINEQRCSNKTANDKGRS